MARRGYRCVPTLRTDAPRTTRVWFVVPPPYHRTVALPADPGLDGFLSSLVDDPRLVHVERLPARAARYGELATPAARRPFVSGWASTGCGRHQAEAIDLAPRRAVGGGGHRHGVGQVALLPGAHRRGGRRPGSARRTALLLFPTKALAQDQLRALTALDVPGPGGRHLRRRRRPEERTWVRGNANVVLTNPEMLHVRPPAPPRTWATFLMRLRYVVVDELHMLRGVFGTHVAHLLRRLRRICAHYGSDPTFVFSSATIGEPGRLASELCGLAVAEVTDDGSPRGERHLRAVEPRPATTTRRAIHVVGQPRDGRADGRADRQRATAPSPSAAAARAPSWSPPTCGAACRPTWPTPCGPTAAATSPPSGARSRPSCSAGRSRGVVATTALELGIDVGGLDACVLNGFPGTIASMWQQAGRAGREAQAVDRRARRRRRPARPVVHGTTPTRSSPGRPSRR